MAALAAAFGFLSVQAAADSLREIRMYPAKEYTRLVIEANELLGYRLAILEEPDRLAIDITASDGDHLLDVVRNRDLREAFYLNNVRSGRFDEKTLRIVFDLSAEVEYSLFTLEPVRDYGNRVVLDITPSDVASRDLGLLQDLGFSAFAPKPSSTYRPPPPQISDEDFLVMIDAGHGGEDPGAVNKMGHKEKHIVLDIAKRLHQRLSQIPNMVPLLTRDTDIFLPLATRVRKAQAVNADLFVSIHADSFTSSRPRGSSVFVLSKKGASSKFARDLAQHANLSDKIGGINSSSGAVSDSVELALTEFAKAGKEKASRSYANLALDHLRTLNVTHGEHVHSAGFAVLKSPLIPSVLVEVGFISNPDDARLLSQGSYRARIAEQLAAAIVEYRERQKGSSVGI